LDLGFTWYVLVCIGMYWYVLVCIGNPFEILKVKSNIALGQGAESREAGDGWLAGQQTVGFKNYK
jgi:hypothetical protein